MICICYKRQLELLARFQHLPTNVGPGLALPSNLLPNAAALGHALGAANAALAAPAALGANAAASPSAQAAAAASLAANPQAQAAAQLAALASAAAAMNAGMGVNLLSPGAGATCASLWPMIAELLKQLALLPLQLLGKLLEVAKLGELVETLKDTLDVDLDAPDWAKDAAKAVGDKLDEAKDNLKKALDAAQAGAGDAAKAANDALTPEALSKALQALQKSANAQATETAQAQALESAATSAQVGLGVNVMAPGGMAALAQKLGALGATSGAMPSALDPVSMAALLAAMQMLAAIDTIKRTLGIDVLAPGAGSELNSLLSSLANSLSQALPLSSALNGAAGAMNAALGGGGSGSAGAGAGAGAAVGAGASAGAGGGASAGAGLGASAAGAGSPLLGPALASMLAGVPGIPLPWLLVAAFAKQAESTLGIQLIQHGPC
jgi:hypothetical protein